MIKITNPMNRDGILYEKGAILTLSLNDELELIDNGLAEDYSSEGIKQKLGDEIYKEDSCGEVGESQKDTNKEVKEPQETKEAKKSSSRIGRTSKK